MHGSPQEHPCLALLILALCPKMSTVGSQRNLALHTAPLVEHKGQCSYNYFTFTNSLWCDSFWDVFHAFFFLWQVGAE